MSKERLVELIDTFCKKENVLKFNKEILDKFADYLFADGWIRPPCKVGDKVYFIARNSGKPIGCIDEIKITHIIKTKDGYSAKGKTNGSDEFYIPDFEIDNYSFFRTREEAEAKLKGNKIAIQ